jgi:hypothetical protein
VGNDHRLPGDDLEGRPAGIVQLSFAHARVRARVDDVGNGLRRELRIVSSTLSAIVVVPVSTTTAHRSKGITVMLLQAPVSI